MDTVDYQLSISRQVSCYADRQENTVMPSIAESQDNQFNFKSSYRLCRLSSLSI